MSASPPLRSTIGQVDSGSQNDAVTTPKPTIRTLREIRQEQGVSLSELAAACGVNKGTLSGIERGRLVATRAELDAISSVLDVRLEVRTLVVHEEPQP